MLTEIVLYGTLEQQFGRYHTFDIDTPAEAVQALAANFPGFEKAIISLPFGLRFIKDDKDVEYVGDFIAPCDGGSLRIVPMVCGAGSDNPLVNILEGIAFIVLSIYLPGSQGIFFEAVGVSLKSIAVYMGASLILTGIAQMLFAPPQPDEKDKSEGSYLFNGPVNVTREGTPVPIGYGRLLVGSTVISGGLYGDLVVLYDSYWAETENKFQFLIDLFHIPPFDEQ